MFIFYFVIVERLSLKRFEKLHHTNHRKNPTTKKAKAQNGSNPNGEMSSIVDVNISHRLI